MNLNLNPNLAQHLLAYDQTFKKVATPAATKRKRSATHLGEITADLLFPGVGDSRILNQAIDQIQRADTVDDRWWLGNGNSVLIYNYRKCWVAARRLWNVPGDFVYEFSYIWPDTPSSEKSLDFDEHHTILVHYFGKDEHLTHDDARIESLKLGRRKFRRIHKVVSCNDIKHFTARPWRLDCLQYGMRTHNIRRAISTFNDDFQQAIPHYRNSNSSWDLFERLIPGQDTWQYVVRKNYTVKADTLDAKALLDTLSFRISYNSHIPCDVLYQPFMMREATATLEYTERLFKATNDCDKILIPIKNLFHYAGWIVRIHQIWPDCPVDFYRNYKTDLMHTDNPQHIRLALSVTKKYLRTNMPVKSFFENLKKDWRAEITGNSAWYRTYHAAGGFTRVSNSSMRDAYAMLEQLFGDGHQPTKPKRWTTQHMHDAWMEQRWKIRTPNESLPQDLFPEPIKVDTFVGKLCFFQPRDIHQLADWGRAVRNCVGGGNYGERVKKKQHFIVLVMLDQKPRFTIQLKLDQGVMRIEQTADVSNARPVPSERGAVEHGLQTAFNQRSTQLSE